MASYGIDVPEEYYEGDWYHYGDNFVTRAIRTPKGFIVLIGYITDRNITEHSDELELIVLKLEEFPLQ